MTFGKVFNFYTLLFLQTSHSFEIMSEISPSGTHLLKYASYASNILCQIICNVYLIAIDSLEYGYLYPGHTGMQ